MSEEEIDQQLSSNLSDLTLNNNKLSENLRKRPRLSLSTLKIKNQSIYQFLYDSLFELNIIDSNAKCIFVTDNGTGIIAAVNIGVAE